MTFQEKIRERARAFTKDNIRDPIPSDYLVIENAMLIGASMAVENEMESIYAVTGPPPAPQPGTRKPGVPSRMELYRMLKKRSEELQ